MSIPARKIPPGVGHGQAPSRLVYTDQTGTVRCVSREAIRELPEEFSETLTALCHDLQLALDCIAVFGGVPTPVALAILRDIEPAHAAIDMAVRGGKKVH